MTSPNGPSNFEYNDDSVVARLSIDVPPQAVTDVQQITQAISALAVQQDYVARSAGTWLDYMQQVPQIMERANQAYRESITQLERMAYIQNEMGGSGPGGNVGPSTGAPPGGGYSTAAPGGYINPFQGMQYGMGLTPDLMNAQQQLGAMASQDPRMYANMMAARGMAVNPALLGMVGGTAAGWTGAGGMGGTGGGMGWGAAAPGSLSSQATQPTRDASAPPDPTQGGAGTRSEPTTIPAEPHEDSPAWVQAAHRGMSQAQQMMNETGAGGGSGRASALLAMAGAGMGAAGKFSQDHPDALGGMAGKLGGMAKGAGLAGLAAAGMGAFQRGGEQIQQYQQLGAVQGGDYQTGMGYEAQARMLALNPFITTEQARSAMQMALSQGFKGGEYDTVMDYMLGNFKEMGVQFSTSKDLIMQNIYAGGEGGVGGASQVSGDLLRSLYELSDKGGASFTQRQQQALDLNGTLTSAGMSPEAAARAVVGSQEGYSENQLLRDQIPGQMQGAMGNQNFLAQVAAQNGITGILPEGIPAALEAKGIDADEAYNEAAKKYAYMAQQSHPDNQINAIATFMNMMNQMGGSLDYNAAEELYKKVLGMDGAQDPTEQANKSIEDSGKGRKNMDYNPITAINKYLQPFRKALDPRNNGGEEGWGDVLGNTWDALMGNEESPQLQRQAGDFAAAGRDASKPPKTPQEAFQGPVRTEGNVQGTLNITVDQNGRVSAPQSIQLSGQQKSANAGYGSAQLNNPPPGDPTFNHSFPGMGGG